MGAAPVSCKAATGCIACKSCACGYAWVELRSAAACENLIFLKICGIIYIENKK
jgi:hypothetical protein